MEKKFALLISFLITALFASNIFVLSEMNTQQSKNIESAILARVIDGDTVELSDHRIIRLLNINSPEKNTLGFELSKEYLKTFENNTIFVEFLGIDKYSRNLARLYSSNASYINFEIVNKGYASKFLVEQDELSLFNNAEKSSMEKGLGIWKRSQYSACIQVKISPKEEILSIKNTCPDIDSRDWYLKDESRKVYHFNISRISNINLHSRAGIDNSTDLYWNSKTDIWNNDRDSIYLFDAEGKLVYSSSYGY